MVKLANNNRALSQKLDDFFPLSHVVWAMMEKVGRKQVNPDMIADGSRHRVDLKLEGLVDGQPFRQQVTSVVTIGHEQQKSSSVTPQVPELVAYILSKLNSATRSRILSDIPSEFSENENQLPESDPALVEEARQMLKSLRQNKTVTARGPIRCEYTL